MNTTTTPSHRMGTSSGLLEGKTLPMTARNLQSSLSSRAGLGLL
jgi:hypothetical protein